VQSVTAERTGATVDHRQVEHRSVLVDDPNEHGHLAVHAAQHRVAAAVDTSDDHGRRLDHRINDA
jgi:hypothetical protein